MTKNTKEKFVEGRTAWTVETKEQFITKLLAQINKELHMIQNKGYLTNQDKEKTKALEWIKSKITKEETK